MVKKPANAVYFNVPCRLVIRPILSLHDARPFHGSKQDKERRTGVKASHQHSPVATHARMIERSSIRIVGTQKNPRCGAFSWLLVGLGYRILEGFAEHCCRCQGQQRIPVVHARSGQIMLDMEFPDGFPSAALALQIDGA